MTDARRRERTVAEAGEQDLIERIRTRLPAPPPWLSVPPGDDAAVLARERNHLDVLTTDAIVEGVHFDRRFVPIDAIGHRALAVNLSDLAAMGAAPRFALLSLVLPAALPLADFDALLDGLLALAAGQRVTLVGGNLAGSPGPLIVDVTAGGTVKPRHVLTRGGARPGDLVFVSGTLGAGRAGLGMCIAALEAGQPPAENPEEGDPRRWYLRPEPRVRLGVLLGRMRAATACMDLSDGLADGARQVCRAGGVGMTIEADQVPIDPGARRWFESRGRDPLTEAVGGGDDYELLFTVSPKRQGRLRGVMRLLRGLTVTRIGTVTREAGVVLRRSGRSEELPAGFAHFASM